MEESKTLVEQLRDAQHQASTMQSGYGCVFQAIRDSLGVVNGSNCHNDGCFMCKHEAFNAIADRIEREYVPLPRFEDGEPVKVGDLVLWNDREAKRVKDIKVEVQLEGSCGTYSSVLKRPAPEVLDADGVPIKVGDVVYFVDNAEAFDVLGVESDGDELVHIGRNDGTSTDAWVSPGELTHKQPDTLERIEADAMKMFDGYWGCGDAECYCCPVEVDGKKPYDRYGTDSCAKAQRLDLLRRQREVLERGQ